MVLGREEPEYLDFGIDDEPAPQTSLEPEYLDFGIDDWIPSPQTSLEPEYLDFGIDDEPAPQTAAADKATTPSFMQESFEEWKARRAQANAPLGLQTAYLSQVPGATGVDADGRTVLAPLTAEQAKGTVAGIPNLIRQMQKAGSDETGPAERAELLFGRARDLAGDAAASLSANVIDAGLSLLGLDAERQNLGAEAVPAKGIGEKVIKDVTTGLISAPLFMGPGVASAVGATRLPAQMAATGADVALKSTLLSPDNQTAGGMAMSGAVGAIVPPAMRIGGAAGMNALTRTGSPMVARVVEGGVNALTSGLSGGALTYAQTGDVDQAIVNTITNAAMGVADTPRVNAEVAHYRAQQDALSPARMEQEAIAATQAQRMREHAVERAFNEGADTPEKVQALFPEMAPEDVWAVYREAFPEVAEARTRLDAVEADIEQAKQMKLPPAAYETLAKRRKDAQAEMEKATQDAQKAVQKARTEAAKAEEPVNGDEVVSPENQASPDLVPDQSRFSPDVPEQTPADVAARMTPEELPQMNRARLEQSLREHFGLSADEASAVMALVDARAASAGVSPDEYIASRIADVRSGERAPEGALNQIEVYHGAPYLFDKFSMDAVGKGEGAQAFGHGLYFTSRKDIAKYYADAVARKRDIRTEEDSGRRIPDQDKLTDAFYEAEDSGFPVIDGYEDILDDIIDMYGEYVDGYANRENLSAEVNYKDWLKTSFRRDQIPRVDAYLQRAFPDAFVNAKKPQRALYDVVLHEGKQPHEYDYIDWRKPVSPEQAAKLERLPEISANDPTLTAEQRAGITRVADEVQRRLRSGEKGNLSGEWIYKSIAKHIGGAKTSQLLLKAGIDGVQYAPEGGRGHGTNYVVFDENAATIRKRELFQTAGDIKKAAVAFLDDGRAIIYALEKPDVSSVLHELGHIFRRDLQGADLVAVEVWAGVKSGKWTTKAEEKFARGFERYLRSGLAPTRELKPVFQRFKEWLTNIYRTIKGTPLEVRLSPEVRKVFDRLLTPGAEASVNARRAEIVAAAMEPDSIPQSSHNQPTVLPEAVAQPAPQPSRPTRSGRPLSYGRESQVVLDNGDVFPVRYVLGEASDYVASHDALGGFQETPGYPQADYQMRKLDGKQAIESMQTASQRARNFDPAQWINSSTSVERSMPIVDAEGFIIAGNNRKGALDLARVNEPERYAAYQAELRARAREFGFTPEQLAQYENPEIWREFSGDRQQAIRLAQLSNVRGTKGMSSREAASAIHRVIRQSDPKFFVELMRQADDAEAMHELARNPDVQRRFIAALARDFAGELPTYLEPDGKLNALGREMLNRTLFFHVFKSAPDGEDLARWVANADDGLRKRIENALFQITKINTDPDIENSWRLVKSIPDAIRFLRDTAEMRAQDKTATVESLLAQDDVLSGALTPPSPKAQLLIRAMESGGVNHLREVLRAYHSMARGDTFSSQAGNLTPGQALRSLVGGGPPVQRKKTKVDAGDMIGADLGAGLRGDDSVVLFNRAPGGRRGRGRRPKEATEPKTTISEIHPVREATDPVTGETNRPFGMPEAIELIKRIHGSVPVVRKLRKEVGGFYRYAQGKAEMIINGSLADNPDRAVRVVLEEAFHGVDHLDVGEGGTQTLRRGNVAGRILAAVKHLKDEFRAGGAKFRNKTIREELKRLSMEVDPFDPEADKNYTRYRYSAAELYARGMAEYVVNPDMVRRWAPEFYAAVNALRGKRPKFAEAYKALNTLLAEPREKVVARREAQLDEMFEEGQAKRREVTEAEDEAKRRASHPARVLASLIDDTHAAVMSFARSLVPDDGSKTRLGKWAGKRFDDAVLRVKDALERMRDDTGRKQHYIDIEREVYEPAKEAGIAEKDLAKIAMLRRIAFGDRSNKFNPNGYTKEDALELLRHMRGRMGDELFEKAESLVRKALDKNQGAIKYAYKRGLITPAQYKAWKANPDYARFSVIEYIEKNMPPDFRTQIGMFKTQIGTFKGVEDPLVATVMQTDSIYRAADWNAAKLELAELARRNGGRRFVKPKMVPGPEEGMMLPSFKHAILKPGESMLQLRRNGELVGMPMPNDVVAAFDYRDNWLYKTASGWAEKVLARPMKTALIKYNLVFQIYTGIMRDLRETTKNMSVRFRQSHGIRKRDYLREFFRRRKGEYIPEVLKVAWANVTDDPNSPHRPEVLEMRGERSLRFVGDNPYWSTPQDIQKDFLRRRGTLPEENLSRLRQSLKVLEKLDPVMRMLDYIPKVGDTLQSATKIAANRAAKRAGVSKLERIDAVRNLAGNPNTLTRGMATPGVEPFLLFANVIQKGVKRQVELMAYNPEQYMKDHAVLNLTPKMLFFAALAGVFGETAKKWAQAWSTYDQDNYNVVPAPPFFSTDKDGNMVAVGLRVPVDDGGRILDGLVMKTLRLAASSTGLIDEVDGQDWSNLFDFGADQIPGVNPLLKVAGAGIDYARGQNPIDNFRNRPIIKPDDFDAGGIEAVMQLGRWSARQLGWSAYSLPEALNRVWKFTNDGYSERQYKELSIAKREEAQRTAGRRRLRERFMETKDTSLLEQGIRDGIITEKEARRWQDDAALTSIERAVKYSGLPKAERDRLLGGGG